MDACIMDGKSMKVGAVTAVQDIHHPISLARKVMEKTSYNFLGSKGAMDLARAEGFKFLKPGSLVTDYARESLERWKQNQAMNTSAKSDVSDQTR
jgi:isoaspartyl peptidase/L-asparaginase-like protein (Ntn-hydrolase superfamily)